MTYVEDHMRETLSHYVLSIVANYEGVVIYRLGPDAKTGMGVVRLIFTRAPLHEQIIITGDLCPGDNGILSNAGYGIDWFGSRKSEGYLCEKFLREVFVPKEALASLVDELGQLRDDDAEERNPEQRRRIWALEEAIADSEELTGESSPVRHSEAFYELWSDVFRDSPEDEGLDYEPRTAGWLCAIQQRFAELYQAKVET